MNTQYSFAPRPLMYSPYQRPLPDPMSAFTTPCWTQVACLTKSNQIRPLVKKKKKKAAFMALGNNSSVSEEREEENPLKS